MNILDNTLSVCEICYRHVPAIRYEKDNQIWIQKKCIDHGIKNHLIEPNANFYLNYKYTRKPLRSYMLDITNRCNLACPNCHQEPDNFSKDDSIDFFLEKIMSWPDDGYPVALCGAEPTVRKDLPEFIEKIQNLPGKTRTIMVLTNGVKLSDINYTKQFAHFKNVMWTIGLNHPEYQGIIVRQKQINGINNLSDLGMSIKNISYTLETLDQMEYCLNEIQEFGLKYCPAFRVRTGVDIGRYPGGPKVYMSDLLEEVYRIAEKNKWSIKKIAHEGNRAHYAISINDIPVKIIQWPDAKTLDLKEVQTEAIGDLVPGKPKSPLIHQIILRDASVNKNLPLLDTIPEEYVKNYGY